MNFANRSYLRRNRSKNVSFGRPCVLVRRSTQIDKMGTKVLESRYDATIEKPTANASGTNKLWAAPVMKEPGMNTARIQSIAMKRGTVVSREATRAARPERLRDEREVGGC